MFDTLLTPAANALLYSTQPSKRYSQLNCCAQTWVLYAWLAGYDSPIMSHHNTAQDKM